MLVVARRGFVGAVARPPLAETLPPVLPGARRLRETVPRAAWNQRPVDRRPVDRALDAVGSPRKS